MQINKKALQLLAALWILIFHLWMPCTTSVAESYIIKIGYIGVDIFFFLSAYSLSGRSIDYLPFLKSRFLKLYGRYIVFIIMAAAMKSWKMVKILKTAFFISFFQSGGGSFLWFIPAILIFYVLFPLFLKWGFRYKSAAVLAAWFVLSCISQKVFGYTKVFIFTNRIPVILLGYALRKHDIPRWVSYVSLPVGLVLVYFFGFNGKLNTPFNEFYYLLALLPVIGFAGLSSFCRTNKVLDVIGGSTLEIYALQMIIGPKLAMTLVKSTGSTIITNIVCLAAVIALSVLLNHVFSLIEKAPQHFKKKTA